MTQLELNREFIECVKGAVRRSIATLNRNHPGETLAGYALLTDDELSTLLYSSVTREALRSSSDPDLLFTPTDWPYEDEPDAFRSLSAELKKRSTESSDFLAHVSGAFSDLEQALAELRGENAFGSDVYLSVISTDPNEYTLERAEAAIVKLNSPEIARARQEFLEKWR
jgi:hypothetical protein